MADAADGRGPEIWVDADACPVVLKDILVRAAQRTGVVVTFIANQPIRTPPLANVRTVQVAKGFDVADHEIARRVVAGDLVVTQDIPLAAEVVAAGALAIGPRGQQWTAENVRARLAVRDFMEQQRSLGVVTGGPPPLTTADRQQFANALDRWLARRAAPAGRSPT